MIYMGKLIPTEIQFLKEIGVSGDLMNLTSESDEWLEIEEKVADELEYRGLNNDYSYNDIGSLCMDILNKIPIER